MFWVYRALLIFLLPVILLRLVVRSFKNPEYVKRVPERFGFIKPLQPERVIWIHAVSVGEVRAAAPLVKALEERVPDACILITTMTPTGSATVRKLFDDRVAHVYVPYDYVSCVRRFLNRARPTLALIMETELWPCLFQECRARGIDVLVANARLSPRSYRGYWRLRSLTRRTLRGVTVAAQSKADAERFVALGADPHRVRVTGSIKFELNLPASLRETAEVWRGQWGRQRPVWLAASTHEGEEEQVLRVFAELKKEAPDLLLVIVPRHPERFESVIKLARRQGFSVARRSEGTSTSLPMAEVFVGDSLGELQIFYCACDVAFVGGSLVPTGGQNLLEAAAVGTAFVFGPHVFNFTEIAAQSKERGAGVQVQNADELQRAVAHFLSDPNLRFEAGEAGKKMIEENRGALARTLELILPVLKA